MYNIIRSNDNTAPYVTEFVVDTESDVLDLPTKTVAPGSTCIVAENSSVYILSPQRIWVKL